MDGVDCSALDVAGDDATAALSGEVGFVIGAGTLGVLSLLLLLAGRGARPRAQRRWSRGGAAAGSLYLLTDGTDCATRLWLAAGAGVAGAALVLCLLGSGFFVLGAGGFGAVAHYVYVALPTGVTGTTPAWSYYAAVGRRRARRGPPWRGGSGSASRALSSALLGGAGLALLAHLIAARAGGAVPAPALLAVTVGASAGGIARCSRAARRGGRRRRGREARLFFLDRRMSIMIQPHTPRRDRNFFMFLSINNNACRVAGRVLAGRVLAGKSPRRKSARRKSPTGARRGSNRLYRGVGGNKRSASTSFGKPASRTFMY